MLSFLEQMLCWVRQIGAMVLAALVDGFNAVLAAAAAAVNAAMAAWPIGMPDLPDAPDELGTAFAWVKWSPVPVDAGFAFILFAITVWILWLITAPILRWAKAID